MEKDIFKPRIEKLNGAWFICDGRRLVRGDSFLGAVWEYIAFIFSGF